MIKQYFDKLKNIMLYGSLTKEQYNEIQNDISISNKKGIIFYILVGVLSLLAVLLFPLLISGHMGFVTSVHKAQFILIFASVVVLIFIWRTKSKYLIAFGVYLFYLVTLSYGIYCAVGPSVQERTTVFLVCLVLMPAIFTVRPLFVLINIIPVEIIYLIVIYVFQRQYPVYQINVSNSILFTLVGIFNGCFISTIKIKSFHNAKSVERMLAYDSLTGVFNRWSFDKHINEEDPQNIIDSIKAVVLLDINGLKRTNDSLGHKYGDKLLCGAAECINKVFSAYGNIYRIGGDEFVALITEGEIDMEACIAELNALTENWSYEQIDKISVSSGYADRSQYRDAKMSDLIKAADKQMYVNKANYYKSTGIDRRR